MKNNTSQTDAILDYLSKGKTLTPLDALNKFGCFRLGARIYDLKKQGYEFNRIMVKTPSGASVAQYSLDN
jgi:hypothetical protein